MNLKGLKSGTDIRGVAMGDRVTLCGEAVKRLAAGFAVFVKNRCNDKNKDSFKIAIGHDSRLSAKNLSEAAIEGLRSECSEVLFCGLSSTPAMFMTTVLNDCDGAIMLTASHHPKDRNGAKFFLRQGGISKTDLDEIIKNAEEYKFLGDNKGARLVCGDFLGDYCEYVKNYFIRELGETKPLSGYKIAVDAGNGAAGFYATKILQPLGADISSSQFLDPDGNFLNHVPNPEDKEAIESISKRVLETKSDLGIIFDTDGDRSAIVLKDGKEINRNRLIAMISAVIIEQNTSVSPIIVTDSVTSEGLKEFIESLGGVHIRYKRGYQNVIGYAKKLCDEGQNAPLAIETSGHGALRENFFLDDGAYLAAKLLIKAIKLKREGKDLSDLIEDLKEPLEEKAFRIALNMANWKEVGQKVLDGLEEFGRKNYRVAEDSFEGIRVYLEGGFFMARMSVHDPVVAVNIETDNVGGAKKIESIVLDIIEDVIDGSDEWMILR